jgi:hypothetical protein
MKLIKFIIGCAVIAGVVCSCQNNTQKARIDNQKARIDNLEATVSAIQNQPKVSLPAGLVDIGEFINLTCYNQERERRSSWPTDVLVGRQYTAYVESPDQELQGGLKPVKCLIKGIIPGYVTDDIIKVLNKAQDGDCYYYQMTHRYEVLVMSEKPGPTWMIVEGMAEVLNPVRHGSDQSPAPTTKSD